MQNVKSLMIFAKEIKSKAGKGANPEKTVIEFRNDRLRGKAGERDVTYSNKTFEIQKG